MVESSLFGLVTIFCETENKLNQEPMQKCIGSTYDTNKTDKVHEMDI